jgi:hypothetical protein
MSLGHCCCTFTCRVCTDETFSRLYATSDTCKARTPNSLAKRQRCAFVFESCSVRITAAMPTTMPAIYCDFSQYPPKNSGILRLLSHAHSLLLHHSVSQPIVLRYRPIARVFTSGYRADPATKYCTMVTDILCVLSMALASWHPSGALDFEMISRFLENFCTAGLYSRSCLLKSLGGADNFS